MIGKLKTAIIQKFTNTTPILLCKTTTVYKSYPSIS